MTNTSEGEGRVNSDPTLAVSVDSFIRESDLSQLWADNAYGEIMAEVKRNGRVKGWKVA